MGVPVMGKRVAGIVPGFAGVGNLNWYDWSTDRCARQRPHPIMDLVRLLRRETKRGGSAQQYERLR